MPFLFSHFTPCLCVFNRTTQNLIKLSSGKLNGRHRFYFLHRNCLKLHVPLACFPLESHRTFWSQIHANLTLRMLYDIWGMYYISETAHCKHTVLRRMCWIAKCCIWCAFFSLNAKAERVMKHFKNRNANFKILANSQGYFTKKYKNIYHQK